MHYSLEFEIKPHPNDEFVFPQPRFKFMDRVALVQAERPDSWEVGEVVGMLLQFSRWADSETLIEQPCWLYNVQQPGHCTNPIWLEETDLVPEANIPDMHAGWDVASEDDDLIESGYLLANYDF